MLGHQDLKVRNEDFSINWGILAETKNQFNLKHGCTFCNMEKHKTSKLDSNLVLNKQMKVLVIINIFIAFVLKIFEPL